MTRLCMQYVRPSGEFVKGYITPSGIHGRFNAWVEIDGDEQEAVSYRDELAAQQALEVWREVDLATGAQP